jgi:hypothetical protein
MPPIPTYHVVKTVIAACKRTHFETAPRSVKIEFCKRYDVCVEGEGEDSLNAALDKALFDAFMQGIEAVTEDGIANMCMYAEQLRLGKETEDTVINNEPFVCMNAFQCGEMTILISTILLGAYATQAVMRELRNIYIRMKVKQKYILYKAEKLRVSDDLFKRMREHGDLFQYDFKVKKIRRLFRTGIFLSLNKESDFQFAPITYEVFLNGLKSFSKEYLKI